MGMSDANGWLPIEAAPRDGTVVLVARGDDIAVAYYDIMSWYLTEVGGYAEDNDLSFDPTHWQPRPLPPIANTPDTVP
jgi:hypothetical protein